MNRGVAPPPAGGVKLADLADYSAATMQAPSPPGAPLARRPSSGRWDASGRSYDPVRCVYNLTPLTLPRWRQRVAEARTGAGNAKVAFLGDSITAGQTATVQEQTLSWPYRWRSRFSALSGLPVYFAATAWNENDARVTMGTGWSRPAGYWLGETSASGTLSFTPVGSFDRITVQYIQQSGAYGSTTVNVDGGSSLGTINTNIGALAGASVTLNCTLGEHTVNFTPPTGNPVIISYIECWNSTAPGVRAVNCAKGGLTSGAFIPQSFPIDVSRLEAFVAPDLTFILLGANDLFSNAGTPAFESNMLQVIAHARSFGDVILMTTPAYGIDASRTYGTHVDYNRSCYRMADELNLPLMDYYRRMGTWAQQTAAGFGAGHATASGYSDVGSWVASALSDIA